MIFAALTIRRHKDIFDMRWTDLKPQKNILSNILKIGIPIALQDGFIQVSFILIAIIANMRGLDDAAAVGIVEKFIGLLFIVPSAMLSTVSAVSAQCIGACQAERARSTLLRATEIVILFGLICVMLIHIFPEAPVRLFTDNENVIKQGTAYLSS